MDDESVKIYTPENSAAARWAADNGHECIICERPEDMPHPEVAYSDDFTYFVNEKEEAVLFTLPLPSTCSFICDEPLPAQ